MGLFNLFKKHNPSDAESRKKRNDVLLRDRGLPVNQWLPMLEEESDTRFREAPEIATRALILSYLGYVGEVRRDREAVRNFFSESGLWDHSSEVERDLLQRDDWTMQEEVNASWRCEASRLLLWAIRKVPHLDIPVGDPPGADTLVALLPGFLQDPRRFIQSATSRTHSEILDCADLTFRLHWAVRDAQLNGRPAPGGLDAGTVMERHHAINWILCYGDDWDTVPTDT